MGYYELEKELKEEFLKIFESFKDCIGKKELSLSYNLWDMLSFVESNPNGESRTHYDFEYPDSEYRVYSFTVALDEDKNGIYKKFEIQNPVLEHKTWNTVDLGLEVEGVYDGKD